MLVALASVKGSPGVTTFTLALATHWPTRDRRLVVECDPSGGDFAMRYGLASSPGLVSLAAIARRFPDPQAVWDHAQPVAGGLGIVVAPPGGVQAGAAVHALSTTAQGALLVQAARAPGVVVLVDCGRMDAGSPADAFARQADVVVLISGSQTDELAHLAARIPDLALWPVRRALMVTGRGYPTAAIERELGVPVMGRIPVDRRLSGSRWGRPSSRWRGDRVARCAARAARTLAALDCTPVLQPAHPPPSSPPDHPGAVAPAVPQLQPAVMPVPPGKEKAR
jgi:hypothetical protein